MTKFSGWLRQCLLALFLPSPEYKFSCLNCFSFKSKYSFKNITTVPEYRVYKKTEQIENRS